MVKNPPAHAGDESSQRPPGEGKGNPLQCSCLHNPTDRGAWRATVHGITESDMTKHTQVFANFNQCTASVILIYFCIVIVQHLIAAGLNYQSTSLLV